MGVSSRRPGRSICLVSFYGRLEQCVCIAWHPHHGYGTARPRNDCAEFESELCVGSLSFTFSNDIVITGTAAASYLLVNSSWSGSVPEGLTLVTCPTRIVWILGRTQTNGEADYDLIHGMQVWEQSGHGAPMGLSGPVLCPDFFSFTNRLSCGAE